MCLLNAFLTNTANLLTQDFAQLFYADSIEASCVYQGTAGAALAGLSGHHHQVVRLLLVLLRVLLEDHHLVFGYESLLLAEGICGNLATATFEISAIFLLL